MHGVLTYGDFTDKFGSAYTGSFGADEGKTAYDAGAWLLASGAAA